MKCNIQISKVKQMTNNATDALLTDRFRLQICSKQFIQIENIQIITVKVTVKRFDYWGGYGEPLPFFLFLNDKG